MRMAHDMMLYQRSEPLKILVRIRVRRIKLLKFETLNFLVLTVQHINMQLYSISTACTGNARFLKVVDYSG